MSDWENTRRRRRHGELSYGDMLVDVQGEINTDICTQIHTRHTHTHTHIYIHIHIDRHGYQSTNRNTIL